jgi:hypothetical protein
MEDVILENGKITTCMEREFTHGLTAEDMKVNTKWIKSMDTVFIIGQTEEFTKEIGSMVNNTGKGNIFYRMERLRLENGKMGKEQIGLMKTIIIKTYQTMLILLTQIYDNTLAIEKLYYNNNRINSI